MSTVGTDRGGGRASLVPVYDRLAEELAGWRRAGRTEPSATAEAELLACHEARLLDDRRTQDWLDRWATDGALWVPIDPDAHPSRDQSFYLDDVRRLRERLAWADQPSAWSQQPRPLTVRVLGNIEGVRHGDGALSVRSSLLLAEQRGGRRQDWVGHQYHRFGPPDDGDGRLLQLKVLVIPALRTACRHPGALL